MIQHHHHQIDICEYLEESFDISTNLALNRMEAGGMGDSAIVSVYF